MCFGICGVTELRRAVPPVRPHDAHFPGQGQGDEREPRLRLRQLPGQVSCSYVVSSSSSSGCVHGCVQVPTLARCGAMPCRRACSVCARCLVMGPAPFLSSAADRRFLSLFPLPAGAPRRLRSTSCTDTDTQTSFCASRCVCCLLSCARVSACSRGCRFCAILCSASSLRSANLYPFCNC
jgi:hypothetical protein